MHTETCCGVSGPDSAEWLLQYVNVTSFLVGNIYVVSGRCRWFSPFVVAMGTLQWTCWNSLFLSFMVTLTLQSVPHH